MNPWLRIIVGAALIGAFALFMVVLFSLTAQWTASSTALFLGVLFWGSVTLWCLNSLLRHWHRLQRFERSKTFVCGLVGAGILAAAITGNHGEGDLALYLGIPVMLLLVRMAVRRPKAPTSASADAVDGR